MYLKLNLVSESNGMQSCTFCGFQILLATLLLLVQMNDANGVGDSTVLLDMFGK